MYKYIKPLLSGILMMSVCAVGYAQDEYDDETSYEPIHTTIYPGMLNFDDVYTKYGSVIASGDDVIFISKMIKSKFFKIEDFPPMKFTLPINPQQNYVVEFNFACPNIKTTQIELEMGNCGVFIGEKRYLVRNTTSEVIGQSPKKWKLKKGEEPDKLSIKIERRGRIITIFANNEYLGEFNSAKNSLNMMPVEIIFSGFGTLIFNSIRVDQGEVSSED